MNCGLVSRGGRLMTAGMLWGKDFVLSMSEHRSPARLNTPTRPIIHTFGADSEIVRSQTNKAMPVAVLAQGRLASARPYTGFVWLGQLTLRRDAAGKLLWRSRPRRNAARASVGALIGGPGATGGDTESRGVQQVLGAIFGRCAQGARRVLCGGGFRDGRGGRRRAGGSGCRPWGVRRRHGL